MERVSHIVVMESVNHLITTTMFNFVRTINDDKGMAIGAFVTSLFQLRFIIKFIDFANEEFRSILPFPFMHQIIIALKAS